MSRTCQDEGAQSGWYRETVAAMSEAKPKLTDSVMVQLPMSQVQPVMKDSTVRYRGLASWKDQ